MSAATTDSTSRRRSRTRRHGRRSEDVLPKDYIPSSTADLWRSARGRLPR